MAGTRSRERGRRVPALPRAPRPPPTPPPPPGPRRNRLDPVTMAGSTEQRHDAQRQALSSLLARFTADRDALITSIRGCQERINELVARLDGAGPAPSSYVAAAGAATPDGDAVRAALAELRVEQQATIEKSAADATLALDRADAALGAALGAVQRLSTLTPDQAAGVGEGDTDFTVTRLESAGGSGDPHGPRERVDDAGAADVAALGLAVARLQTSVDEVTARTMTAAGDPQEWQQAVEQVRSELGRVEAKTGDRIDAGIRNAARGWDAAIAALRAQVEKLEGGAVRT